MNIGFRYNKIWLSLTHLSDWLFWLSWVAASTMAILLGIAILFVLIGLAKAVDPGINEELVFGAIMFPILGTVLGAGQWLILRTRIPGSGWWVLATGVGMLVGVPLGDSVIQAISYITRQPWDWDYLPGHLLLYLFIGLSLTTAQLFILRRHIKGAALWLTISMLGWLALGLVVGKSIDRTSDIFAVGAVPAMFTGLGLIWLIRTPRSQPTQPLPPISSNPGIGG